MLQQVQSFYEHRPLDVNVSIKMGAVHETQERVRLPKDSVHRPPTALAAHQLRGDGSGVELATLVSEVIFRRTVIFALHLLLVFGPCVRVGAIVCVWVHFGALSTAGRADLGHVAYRARVPFALAAFGIIDALKRGINTYHRERWCLIALVDHAVTLVVGHHDGRVDLQPFLFFISPVELHVPPLPPRHHERPISIRAKAHIVVAYVVEDSVGLSSHRRINRHLLHPFQTGREGVTVRVRERVRVPNDSVHRPPTALAAHHVRGEGSGVELATLFREDIFRRTVPPATKLILLRV